MREPEEILKEWVENGVVGGVIGEADGHREERGGEQATGSYAEGTHYSTRTHRRTPRL